MTDRIARSTGRASCVLLAGFALLLAGCTQPDGGAGAESGAEPTEPRISTDDDASADAFAVNAADSVSEADAAPEIVADDAAAHEPAEPAADTAVDLPDDETIDDALASAVAPEPATAAPAEPANVADGATLEATEAANDAGAADDTTEAAAIPGNETVAMPAEEPQPPAPDPIDPALYGGPFDGPIDSRLVTAPELFEARATLRWNGTRTLRGIWLAHPRATRPERVRIVNLGNGRAADGAIFRREGTQADDPPQISSEGAAALGMRVNRDADLVIVGLRYAEPPAEDVSTVLLEIGSGPVSGPSADGAAAALLALQPVVETGTALPPSAAPAEPKDAGAPVPEPEIAAIVPVPTSEPDDATSGDTTGTAAETEEPALTRVAPPPDPAAASPAATAAAEPDATSSNPETAAETSGERAADPPAAPAETQAIAVQTATAPSQDPPALEKPAPEPAAAGPGSASPRTTAADAPDLSTPYIQVGIFALPANSDRLLEVLEAEGIAARGLPITRSGRPLTRILAGPFGTVAERDSALRTIEALGIRDARLSRD